MQIKVYRIDTKKDFKRDKYYEQVDISNQVQQPIVDVDRLDTTLDSTSLTILNKEKDAIKPFTRFKIILADDGVVFDDYGNKLSGNGEVKVIYRVVYSDSPSISNWSADESKIIYQHQVELLEITKCLERFDVDNTTITNYLMFLYSDEAVYLPYQVYPTTNFSWKYISMQNPARSTLNLEQQTNDVKIYNTYQLNERYNIDATYSIELAERSLVYYVFAIPFISEMDLVKFTIDTPTKTYNLKDTTASNYRNPNNFLFDEVGNYVIKKEYIGNGTNTICTYTQEYEINCADYSSVEVSKLPHKHTIREVITKILSGITSENSIALKNEAPLFQLDANLIDLLDNIESPEFTFTQNTLFGVLMEIGQYIHAIPRLVPNKAIGDNLVVDDISSWNVITFDFWGDYTQGDLGKQITIDKSINGDNYTSAYVSNVENSFQVNNQEYISMVEPFEDAFVSTRTESANFEISNDECCIKTSRPIHRITELIVGFYDKDDVFTEVDIANFVKESAEYNLLQDYPTTATINVGTKSTALCYTRGDNKITGLTYVMPSQISSLEVFGKNRAILNILTLKTRQDYFISSSSFYLKNLMFRIKYVPYYNFKVKQYKPIIDENSGSNNLYYNQASQGIDIEAFGENVKGALMQVGNEEQTITSVYTRLGNIIQAGQVVNENYFAYQVNKEITTSAISTTTTFSKDWNKWNEYVAIKKNYREWEISEKECISQNPIYNDFCIISDEIDMNKMPEVPSGSAEFSSLKKLWEDYAEELSKVEMFGQEKSLQYVMASMVAYSQSGDNYKLGGIRWMIGQTKQQEWDGTTYKDVSHAFMLPVGCFSVGNSIVITASAQDNYSVGTFVDETGLNTGYALEQYLEYGNKYGEAKELKVWFGSKDYRDTNWALSSTKLVDSKRFYNVDISQVQRVGALLDRTTPTLLQIADNPIILNKDSRQQINLTFQLNFVSDKDYIWIGSALAQNSFLVGNTTPSLRVAYFKRKPNKFLAEKMVKDVDYVVGGTINSLRSSNVVKYGVSVDSKAVAFDTKSSNINPTTREYVGAGLIDTNGNIVLYYNRALGKYEYMPYLYFQFRRKI